MELRGAAAASWGVARDPVFPAGDLAEGAPPPAAGAALRRGERCLAAGLGLAWLLLAGGTGAEESPAARAALAVCGAGALAGLWPRLVTPAGVALTLMVATREGPAVPAALLLAGAAAARFVLHLGEAGRWLDRVRGLEMARTRALAGMELARARARGTAGGEVRARALREAGDHYERAGRLRGELAALGADTGRSEAWLRRLATGLAHLLSVWPALRDRVERALAPENPTRS